MDVEVKVNVGALQQRLEYLYRQLKAPREASRAASIALYGWTIRHYDSEGDGQWAPLAPSTIARKAKLGKEKKLVIDGTMRASILPFHDDTDAGVGTPLTSRDGAPYPKFHQEGTSRMPARAFLPDRSTALGIGLNVYGHFVQRQIAVQRLK